MPLGRAQLGGLALLFSSARQWLRGWRIGVSVEQISSQRDRLDAGRRTNSCKLRTILPLPQASDYDNIPINLSFQTKRLTAVKQCYPGSKWRVWAAGSGWCLRATQPSGEVVALEGRIQDLDRNEPQKDCHLGCAYAPCPRSPLSLSSLLIKENVCERQACHSSAVKTKRRCKAWGQDLTSSLLILNSPPGMQGTGCLAFQQTEHTGEAAWETEKGT